MINPKDFSSISAFNQARFDAIHRGDLVLPGFLRPCRVRLLIVCDGYPGSFLNVTYGKLYFSLSAVVDTLKHNPEPWVKFDITKAHRQTDPLGEADIENFRFTNSGFDINAYDQVWLFGARNDVNDSLRLDDDELSILSRWMDLKQGGVFATGDHADLGASLCARVPRVRSMRKWTGATVPQPTGLNRHDTLRKGHDAYYTFNDESDDVPMNTDVTLFPVSSFSPFFSKSAPHPVLCGTAGIINILPDHPHEGEVIDPLSLTGTFSFPGYTNKPEYPESSPGVRETPHVIARAHVQGDHTEGRGGASGSDRNKGPANAKTFGAVGAYDGHAADVGRVVVDSTWHHWFDVNLIGRPTDPGADQVDPVSGSDPKAVGYPYSPAGTAAYEQIKNYFRNVALWLAPPASQSCMFFRATWRIFQMYPLNEQLSIKTPIWELGGYALDAIGRHAGQCTVRTWIFDHLPIQWRELFKLPHPDPCLSCPPVELIELAAIGGIMHEFLLLTARSRDLVKLDEASIAKAFSNGARNGLKQAADLFKRSQSKTREVPKQLAALAADFPSAEVFSETLHSQQLEPKATRRKAKGKKKRRAKKR